MSDKFIVKNIKIFKIGYNNNNFIIKDAIKDAFKKGLFENVPIILYKENKKYCDTTLEKEDDIVGVVSHLTHINNNNGNVYANIILWKNYDLNFNLKKYEIEINDYAILDPITIVTSFTPLAIFID